MISILLATAALAMPQDPGPALRSLAARSDGIAVPQEIGRSLGDRPIWALVIARPADTPPERRPGILIAAGADGGHRLGTDLALWQAEKLVTDAASDDSTRALLERCVVYIVPQINPDGPALERTGNSRALDLDRDGARDEDGTDDLDGNGVITQMRWRDPEGEWIVDPDESRVMRKADRDKGERGEFKLAVEAADSDGDTQRAEDHGQGTQICRNFAHRHDEFDRATGPYPMSEPSTRAFADFVFGHRNIVVAFAYDRDDNLLAKPKSDKPKPRVQLKGVLEGDVKWLDRAGELYREKTEREGKTRARMDGSLWAWLHFQAGIPTLATDVWRVPEPTGKDKEADKNGDRARLAHCDAVSNGFVAWKQAKHEELGEVEIGGFVQGADWKLLAVAEREPLFAAHHEFALAIADRLPRVRLDGVEAKPLEGGAFEIEAAVVNDGEWPALTAGAVRSRRFSRPRVKLELGEATLVAGTPDQRTRNLEGLGDRQTFHWIVMGAAGTTVVVHLTSDPAGRDRVEVKL